MTPRLPRDALLPLYFPISSSRNLFLPTLLPSTLWRRLRLLLLRLSFLSFLLAVLPLLPRRGGLLLPCLVSALLLYI
jgi:hypothetical protein